MSLQSMMIKLPGIDQFIADIIDDCYDRKSVVVVVPPQLDVYEIEYLIREKISEQGLNFKEAILPELPMGEQPAAQLGIRFSVKWVSQNCPMTVKNLLASSGLPECILLCGFTMIGNENKALWLDFLNSWNKVSLSAGTRGIQQKPAICLVLAGTDIVTSSLDSVPQLSIRHWFGFPSALEIRLLCRFSEVYSRGQKEKARWREYLLPSLVQSDVYLADKLWNTVIKPVNEIVDFLSQDASMKRWDKELLLKWGLNNFLRNNERETDISRILAFYPDLFANGVLCCTLEYGTEVHSSALAAIEKYDQIKNRMWRGQLPLLLPMVDNIRLFICDHLTERQGGGWPLFFPPKEAEEVELVKSNPRACQLGHLYHAIQNHPQFIDEKKFIPLISITKKIRNELAHYRPVNFSDYQKMVTEAKKLGLYI